jgi:hypothetical protein
MVVYFAMYAIIIKATVLIICNKDPQFLKKKGKKKKKKPQKNQKRNSEHIFFEIHELLNDGNPLTKKKTLSLVGI